MPWTVYFQKHFGLSEDIDYFADEYTPFFL